MRLFTATQRHILWNVPSHQANPLVTQETQSMSTANACLAELLSKHSRKGRDPHDCCSHAKPLTDLHHSSLRLKGQLYPKVNSLYHCLKTLGHTAEFYKVSNLKTRERERERNEENSIQCLLTFQGPTGKTGTKQEELIA